MFRTNLPAVSPSNFIKINGATTHEKKTIDPASTAASTSPRIYKVTTVMEKTLKTPQIIQQFVLLIEFLLIGDVDHY